MSAPCLSITLVSISTLINLVQTFQMRMQNLHDEQITYCVTSNNVMIPMS
jgi:hypothetical protein